MLRCESVVRYRYVGKQLHERVLRMTSPANASTSQPFGADLGGQPSVIAPADIQPAAPVEVDGNGYDLVPDAIPEWAANVGNLGAVALGTGVAAAKLPPITQGLKIAALSKLNDPNAPGSMKGMFNDARKWADQPGAINELKNYGRENSAKVKSEWGKWSPQAGEKVSNAKSFTKGLGEKVFKNGAPKGFKAATGAGRMVGKLAASSLGKKAAGVGVKMGLRMAAFAIPGPGWAVGAATLAVTWLIDPQLRGMVKNFVGGLFGKGKTPAFDAAPNPPDTLFLPTTGDGGRDGTIRAKDSELQELNNAMFGFNPDKVWHPTNPEIETTPSFESSMNQMMDLMTRASDLSTQVDAVLAKYSGDEQLVSRAQNAVRPTLTSLAAVGTDVVNPLGNAVTTLATETNNSYQALRDVNVKSRKAITNSASGIVPWDFHVDESAMGSVSGVADRYVAAANDTFKTVDQAVQNWQTPTAMNQQKPESSPQTPTPQAEVPQAQTTPVPSTPSGTGGWSGSSTSPSPSTTTAAPSTTPSTGGQQKSLSDLLSSLSASPAPNATPGQGQQGQQAAMPQNNPLASGLNNLAQGLGQGLNGMNGNGQQGLGQSPTPQAFKPDAMAASIKDALKDKPKTEDKKKDSDKDDKDKDKDDDKDAKKDGADKDDDAKDDVKPADGGAKEPGGTPVVAEPGEAAPPPADPPAGEPGAVEAAPASLPGEGDPGEGSKTATVDGKPVDFSDPRTAKMATALAPTDGTPAPTLEKAAGDAGFKIPPLGQDIGAPVTAADMRPGDLVVGADARGVFLGDGNVLVDGEVRPIGDVAVFTGEHQGIFRLDSDAAGADPGAPVPAPGPAEPVSADQPAAPAADGTSTGGPTTADSLPADSPPADSQPAGSAPAADSGQVPAGDSSTPPAGGDSTPDSDPPAADDSGSSFVWPQQGAEQQTPDATNGPNEPTRVPTGD